MRNVAVFLQVAGLVCLCAAALRVDVDLGLFVIALVAILVGVVLEREG